MAIWLSLLLEAMLLIILGLLSVILYLLWRARNLDYLEWWDAYGAWNVYAWCRGRMNGIITLVVFILSVLSIDSFWFLFIVSVVYGMCKFLESLLMSFRFNLRYPPWPSISLLLEFQGLNCQTKIISVLVFELNIISLLHNYTERDYLFFYFPFWWKTGDLLPLFYWVPPWNFYIFS